MKFSNYNIEITPSGGLKINGYTNLGNNSPAIKTKKFTGITGDIEGSEISFAHGIDSTKIISINAIVNTGVDNIVGITPAFSTKKNYKYDMWYSSTNIYLKLHTSNSLLILSRPYTILITYEE